METGAFRELSEVSRQAPSQECAPSVCEERDTSTASSDLPAPVGERLLVRLLVVWLIVQVFHFERIWPSIGDRTIARTLLILIVLFFVWLVVTRKLKLPPVGGIDVMMALFTFVATVSYLTFEPDQGGSNRWFVTLTNLSFSPFIAWFIARTIPYRRNLMKILLMGLCVLGFYLAAIGVVEQFQIQSMAWPKYILESQFKTQPGRVNGPIGNSGGMGHLVIVTFLIMLMLASGSRGLRRLIFWMFLALGMGTIYLTYTRSVWLGFALAVIISAVLNRKVRWPAYLIGTLVFLCFLTGVTGKFSLFQETLFSKRQNTVNGRMIGWQVTLNMFKSNPLFGIGYGKLESEWFNFLPKASEVEFGPLSAQLPDREEFDGNHNTYLGILAELGIFGFLLYISIYVFSALMCWRTYLKIRETGFGEFEQGLVVLVIASMAMQSLNIFFYDARYAGLQNSLIFLLLGYVRSLSSELTSGSQADDRRAALRRPILPAATSLQR